MRKKAFTLIELLVVIAILALLVSILLPSLGRAKALARSVVCRSNLRQIHLANQNYVTENAGFYVAAAPDIWDGFGGHHRWHGVRQASAVHPDPEMNMFDPLKGPLSPSLSGGEVKQCPEIVDFVQEGAQNAFEASCGGYGYNSVGVGSRCYQYGYCDKAMRTSMQSNEILKPTETVMFIDTAFIQGYPNRYIVEYSFCEPPLFVFSDGAGGIVEHGTPAPSIHFRHLDRTNVIWCDGHADDQPFAFSTLEPEVLSQFRVGWFGPDTNELFDLN